MLALGTFLVFLQPASAATPMPVCSLYLLHNGTIVETQSKTRLQVVEDDLVGLLWHGMNASAGVNGSNKKIDLLGVEIVTPKRDITYAYTFSQGSERVTCSVDINVVSGSLSTKSAVKSKEKITFSGQAEGVSNVMVSIYDALSTTSVYTTKSLSVKNNRFTFKMPKALPDGRYRIELNTTGSQTLVLATSTIMVGKAPLVPLTTLVLQRIPLLSGGVVKLGRGVAVSYFQVINVGTSPANITGFSFGQIGNAPASTMTGVTVTDELGTARGSSGNMVSGTPFIGTTVNVPLLTTLAPKESRLFTARAVVSTDAASKIGQTISLALLTVSANARVQSVLPVYGVVWTIGL